ncbi:hypothetical protein BBC27_09870 [Acidithiobacillus ferrivorans]|uniref:Uncharacterized protein n=1 Tax=Acidithiobacillus ferrivorans TaxID=160808 RepID=A0A1B9BZG8_9PROT|nr:hypothetical protein BBC27_09870 [Acidithiobacillus ferrivorans]
MQRSLSRLVNLMLLASFSSALPFAVIAYATVADSTIHNIETGALSPLIVQTGLAWPVMRTPAEAWRGR